MPSTHVTFTLHLAGHAHWLLAVGHARPHPWNSYLSESSTDSGVAPIWRYVDEVIHYSRQVVLSSGGGAVSQGDFPSILGSAFTGGPVSSLELLTFCAWWPARLQGT